MSKSRFTIESVEVIGNSGKNYPIKVYVIFKNTGNNAVLKTVDFESVAGGYTAEWPEGHLQVEKSLEWYPKWPSNEEMTEINMLSNQRVRVWFGIMSETDLDKIRQSIDAHEFGHLVVTTDRKRVYRVEI